MKGVVAALDHVERRETPEPCATWSSVPTRHVFSTTVTTIAGFFPLILAGGGFWPPLAIAIASGVAGATILALYFVPAVYVLMNRRRAAVTVTVTAQPVGSVA